jgi:hypothetical protein
MLSSITKRPIYTSIKPAEAVHQGILAKAN